MLNVKKCMFRFLDKEGTFSRPDYFVPLGHGRRVCMGEPLAKAELAIFFVTIVQVMNILCYECFDDSLFVTIVQVIKHFHFLSHKYLFVAEVADYLNPWRGGGPPELFDGHHKGAEPFQSCCH